MGSAALGFRQVAEQTGSKFISTILYCEIRGKLAGAKTCPNVLEQRLIWGGVSYGNPVLNARQSAQWLTETDFKCCPSLRQATMPQLLDDFECRFGMALDPDAWPDTLVRLAIPFAKQRVLIVAPSRSFITQEAQIEARRRGVRLDFVPLSYLSAPLVRQIQTQWLVRPVDKDATDWPDDAIRFLGRPTCTSTCCRNQFASRQHAMPRPEDVAMANTNLVQIGIPEDLAFAYLAGAPKRWITTRTYSGQLAPTLAGRSRLLGASRDCRGRDRRFRSGMREGRRHRGPRCLPDGPSAEGSRGGTQVDPVLRVAMSRFVARTIASLWNC